MAGGDFASVDFVAAASSSYNHATGGGAFDDDTSNVDTVEQLEGGDFADGDIVTFFTVLNLQEGADNQTVRLTYSFGADSNGQSGAGYTEVVGVSINRSPIQDLLEADTNEDGIFELDPDSTATLVSDTLDPGDVQFQGGTNSNRTAAVDVTGLDVDETVIVRIDVRLKVEEGSSPGGNLDARLTSAEVIYDPSDSSITEANPSSLPGSGAQTITLKQVDDIDTETPNIDVEKEVSVDGGINFVDADTVTGPSLLASGVAPQFKFVVTNTGNVALEGITLSDSDFDLNGDDAQGTDITIASLAAGGRYEYILTGATWQAGQHTNTATVEGSYNGTTVSDSDDANYFGADPSLDVKKEVSVNGGINFVDADTVTGPILHESGEDPIFRFVVTNMGNVALEGITLSDSDFDLNLTPFNLAANDGQPGGADEYEYIFTEATWQAGQHTNTATAKGTYTDDAGNSSTISHSNDANYFGANPAFDIQKYVSVDGGITFDDADTPTGPLAIEDYPDPIFKFVVTNTGNVPLEDITLSDSDFDLNGAAAGTEIVIDSLGVGGTYQTTITAPWQLGQHTNTATIDTTYTDDAGNTDPLTGMDDANYLGVEGPGVRTPGFWSRWTAVWNRNTTDDSTFNTKAFFPDGDILVYKNGDPTDALPNGGRVIDPVTGQLATGLLIGDYNQSGTTDAGEETIFYSLDEALKIVNASLKTQQDVRYTLDRSLVASWLNYVAGNPGNVTDMDNAIDWLQAVTPDETGDGAGDGYLKGLGSASLDLRSPSVAASSAAWNSGIGSIPAGSQINGWLDRYNNLGIGSEGPIAAVPM